MKFGFALVFMCLFATSSSGSIIVDQQQLDRTRLISFGPSDVQQGITAGVTGTLDGFDFVLTRIGGSNSGEVTAFVNLGEVPQTDANDFEATVLLTASDMGDFYFVDTSSADIMLNSGDQFVIGLRFDVAPNSIIAGPGELYSAGQLFIGAGLSASDMTFRTYVSPIPEPSAALIWTVLGLVGVGCRRRSRLR